MQELMHVVLMLQINAVFLVISNRIAVADPAATGCGISGQDDIVYAFIAFRKGHAGYFS
jgi:hypothetical protein